MALNSNQVKSPQAGVHADIGGLWWSAEAVIGCGPSAAEAAAIMHEDAEARLRESDGERLSVASASSWRLLYCYFRNFEMFSLSQPATDRGGWPVKFSTVDVVSASADS